MGRGGSENTLPHPLSPAFRTPQASTSVRYEKAAARLDAEVLEAVWPEIITLLRRGPSLPAQALSLLRRLYERLVEEAPSLRPGLEALGLAPEEVGREDLLELRNWAVRRPAPPTQKEDQLADELAGWALGRWRERIRFVQEGDDRLRERLQSVGEKWGRRQLAGWSGHLLNLACWKLARWADHQLREEAVSGWQLAVLDTVGAPIVDRSDELAQALGLEREGAPRAFREDGGPGRRVLHLADRRFGGRTLCARPSDALAPAALSEWAGCPSRCRDCERKRRIIAGRPEGGALLGGSGLDSALSQALRRSLADSLDWLGTLRGSQTGSISASSRGVANAMEISENETAADLEEAGADWCADQLLSLSADEIWRALGVAEEEILPKEGPPAPGVSDLRQLLLDSLDAGPEEGLRAEISRRASALLKRMRRERGGS